MARRSANIPAEPLVPVAEVAIRTGQLEEPVWRLMEQKGWRAVPDWGDSWCMSWTQAREIYLELTAAKADYDRLQHEYTEKQQAAELAGRMQPVTAYENAKARAERRVPGVMVSGPDAEREPDWMRGGEDE